MALRDKCHRPLARTSAYDLDAAAGRRELFTPLGLVKKEFTKDWLAIGGHEQALSRARRKRGDRGIWQPRYWEHTIANEGDFERHFDYLHYNPVKHGHVTSPGDWPESSFHRWVKAGVYEPDWGASHRGPL